MKYNAVILAGAKNTNLVAQDITVNYEALLQVVHRPMITYVLKALVASEKIKQVVVIGPKDEEGLLLASGADLVIKARDNLLENIKLGISNLSNSVSEHFLLVSSDIPLITKRAIDDFIANCEEEWGSDFYYPIIPKERCLSIYPEADKTYVRLKEGSYTGGNLVLVNPELLIKSKQLINRIIENRKNTFKLSWMLGWKFLFKLFCGYLSLIEVEDRFSELFNFSMKAIVTDYAELGFDVDKPQDLEVIRRLVVNA